MSGESIIKAVFPEADYYVQRIRCEDCLDGNFFKVVGALSDSDDLAAHLAAGADYVVMHRRLAPPDGTIFVKIFQTDISLNDREKLVYKRWYPTEKFLLLGNDGRRHCWLSDYLEGKPPTVGTFKLQ